MDLLKPKKTVVFGDMFPDDSINNQSKEDGLSP
jgi:hypothetical protein